MRALVVGGGSIGSRHLNNLRSLGIRPLAVVEPETERRQTLSEMSAIVVFESLEQGLAWGPHFVVIATPSHLHVGQALQAARHGCHLFIEKPLAHVDVGLEDLCEEVLRRGLVTLVGCNMRFHPGPAKVKELLDKKAIGRLLFARIHAGSYLPDWRPRQDYRGTYSANEAMGGGCILDFIHEIDLASWYLGAVDQVFCMAGHQSSLEMDVEDVAALILRHTNEAISEVHLDYVQRTYERGCQIVGERGTIFWDYGCGVVRWLDAHRQTWESFAQPQNWQVNQMYVDEMSHFLSRVRAVQPTVLPVSDATSVMRIAFAAKTSTRSGCLVSAKGNSL